MWYCGSVVLRQLWGSVAADTNNHYPAHLSINYPLRPVYWADFGTSLSNINQKLYFRIIGKYEGACIILDSILELLICQGAQWLTPISITQRHSINYWLPSHALHQFAHSKVGSPSHPFSYLLDFWKFLILFLIGVLRAISDLGDLVFRLLGLSWISGLPVLDSFSAPFIVLSVSASILLVVLVVVVVVDFEMF